MKSNLSNAEVNFLRTELFDTVFETMDNGVLIHGIDYVEGHSTAGIWHSSNRIGDDFLKRREAFLWILERLLKEGRIKLHKSGVFLESSIEDQIEAFRHAWPTSIKNSGYEDFYWWFFDPECPAGIAWRREDGSYEIAD
jgi:hypothetical protein